MTHPMSQLGDVGSEFSNLSVSDTRAHVIHSLRPLQLRRENVYLGKRQERTGAPHCRGPASGAGRRMEAKRDEPKRDRLTASAVRSDQSKGVLRLVSWPPSAQSRRQRHQMGLGGNKLHLPLAPRRVGLLTRSYSSLASC